MISLSVLTRLAKGSLNPDELAELLSSLGIEMEMQPVEREKMGDAFTVAAQSALRPDAKLLAVRGKMKNGDGVDALIVLIPCPAQKNCS